MWEVLGQSGSLLHQPWPEYDPALAKEEEIQLAVQVNGKVRSHILVSADATSEEIRQKALEEGKIRAATSGKQLANVIVVPGKLVNIVLR
jgi:leucyl-tRNA synthetase